MPTRPTAAGSPPGDDPPVARRARSLGLFLLIVVLFGGAFPAIEVGLEFVPPLLLAAARYALSAVLLLGYAAVTGGDWRPRTAADWTAVAAGGVLFVGGTGLTFVGMQFTTSGIAAILFSLVPVLTVLVGWLLLPAERPSRRSIAGVLVGFLGVALVVSPGASAVDGAVLLGNVLVLLAAVSVVLGTVLVRRAHPPMPTVALTGWAMLLGAAVQLAFSAALGESLASVRLLPTALLALAYLSVLAGGVGFVVYFELLDRFGALEVNLVTYLNPIVAVFVGWAFLGEPLVASALVGLLVVFAGFVLLTERELAAELARYRGAAR